MLKAVYDYMLQYRDQTTLRAAIKSIPGGGEAIDFWLSEKFSMKLLTEEDLWTTKPYASRLQNIQELLDLSHFNSDTILRTRSFAPNIKLNHLGPFKFDAEQKAISRKYARDLKEQNKPDDPCAVLILDPVWTDDPLSFKYHSLFYSEVLALREQGKRVKLVSANVVVYCEESRCILAHRRSDKSADFCRTLHTFGGAYMPPGVGQRGDLGGLKECVERELHEESGLGAAIPNGTPIVLLEEPSIDYVQVAFLGVNIPSNILDRSRETWEGDVVRIPFDELEVKLCNFHDWTPSGLLHILFWLALDAPNSKAKLKFAGKSADSVLKKVVAHILNQGAAACDE